MKEIFCLITGGEKKHFSFQKFLSTGKYESHSLEAISGDDSTRDYFPKREVFLETYFP